ncbi:DUF5701 family protein [Cellulomonas sp. NPDC089187]|uniref:DUF5701 family protein n=1 Tax=Cellulomonas sp. NPDC089187 TaxID=3154970 RepID=UPI00343039F0
MGLSDVPHNPNWPTTADHTSPAEPYDPTVSAADELARQLRAYQSLGVTAALGWSEQPLPTPPENVVLHEDHIPFLLVLDPAPSNALVPAMRRGSTSGVSVIDDQELAGYSTVDQRAPYLLVDVDTGSEFCNQTPEHALTVVQQRGRVGLTIAEGLALVTVRPDMLRPNKCFSLMASRAGNQRVPAIWISQRRPKLGWCWDRNPHTWLGAASAGGRVDSTR